MYLHVVKMIIDMMKGQPGGLAFFLCAFLRQSSGIESFLRPDDSKRPLVECEKLSPSAGSGTVLRQAQGP